MENTDIKEQVIEPAIVTGEPTAPATVIKPKKNRPKFPGGYKKLDAIATKPIMQTA